MKLIDTCAHPTLNGKWIQNSKGQSFEEHFKCCEKSNVINACAIGLPGIGDYEHKRYFDAANAFGSFYYPVAAITKTNLKLLADELEVIKDIGFKAVKLHPRLLRFELNQGWLNSFFYHCARLDFIVFYCSYPFCTVCNMPGTDHFCLVVNALKTTPHLKIVLLHGGGVELMKFAELTRFNENILLDLSLTIMKYQGSSLDLDIQFLLEKFDRRISIGTDHPEWDISEVRRRIDYLSPNVSPRKLKNVMSLNALNFLSIASTEGFK